MSVHSSPSSVQPSKIPADSGFWQIGIKVRGTETRTPRTIYLHTDRNKLFAVSEGDTEQKFRGPEVALDVVGYIADNGKITFPNNREYEAIETFTPVNTIDDLSKRTQRVFEQALRT